MNDRYEKKPEWCGNALFISGLCSEIDCQTISKGLPCNYFLPDICHKKPKTCTYRLWSSGSCKISHCKNIDATGKPCLYFRETDSEEINREAAADGRAAGLAFKARLRRYGYDYSIDKTHLKGRPAALAVVSCERCGLAIFSVIDLGENAEECACALLSVIAARPSVCKTLRCIDEDLRFVITLVPYEPIPGQVIKRKPRGQC